MGISASFYSLSQALLHVPLSIAYAIWSGVGTALMADGCYAGMEGTY
ncbi:SMR family transporter [Sporomusa rhizae]